MPSIIALIIINIIEDIIKYVKIDGRIGIMSAIDTILSGISIYDLAK